MSRAVLLSAVTVALALLGSVDMLPRPRYTLAQLSDGVALRLDTRTGDTFVCILSRECHAGTTKYTTTCDGLHRH